MLCPYGLSASLSFFRICPPIHLPEQGGVAIEAEGKLWSLGTEDLFLYLEGALQQPLGLVVLAFNLIDPGQATECAGYLNVLGAKDLLPDRECAAEQWLCLCGIAFGLVEGPEMAKRERHLQMLGSPHLLLDRQSPFQERLGLRIPRLREIERPEII